MKQYFSSGSRLRLGRTLGRARQATVKTSTPASRSVHPLGSILRELSVHNQSWHTEAFLAGDRTSCTERQRMQKCAAASSCQLKRAQCGPLFPTPHSGTAHSESENESVSRFATPWTVACQAPLMEFSRQEYWSGLPFSCPGDLPNSNIESRSPTLQTDS